MFTFATQFLHSDLRLANTCSHISWLSTNQPFTQYSMRASGTGFSLMKSGMRATQDSLQHVMYE